MSASLDAILDAASRVAGKHPSQLSDEQLGITCAKTDPNAAKFIREFILEFGTHHPERMARADATTQSGDTVSTEVQRLEAQLAAAKQRASVIYKEGEMRGDSYA